MKVISADELLCTNLRREKFLFTKSRFLHQDDDPTKPPTTANIKDVQPVDGLGNVLPIYGSSVTDRVPQYLVDPHRKISSKALTHSDKSDYSVKLIVFGRTITTGDVQ